mmetsp:Transcript_2408/g.4654  ORF Transcript_2408/g.4654 Transcript_2408/m.4654 type:complete len:245 (+) Transcript_2408:376-1110(+)
MRSWARVRSWSSTAMRRLDVCWEMLSCARDSTVAADSSTRSRVRARTLFTRRSPVTCAPGVKSLYRSKSCCISVWFRFLSASVSNWGEILGEAAEGIPGGGEEGAAAEVAGAIAVDGDEPDIPGDLYPPAPAVPAVPAVPAGLSFKSWGSLALPSMLINCSTLSRVFVSLSVTATSGYKDDSRSPGKSNGDRAKRNGSGMFSVTLLCVRNASRKTDPGKDDSTPENNSLPPASKIAVTWSINSR